MVSPPETQWALNWLLASWGVGRYPTSTTGEQLTILTIVVLNQSQHPPTLADLIKIVGLPQSTLSRYVTRQIDAGFVEEIIDPTDRRRRLLKLTDEAWREMQLHEAEVNQFLAHLGQLSDNGVQDGIPSHTLKDLLSATAHKYS